MVGLSVSDSCTSEALAPAFTGARQYQCRCVWQSGNPSLGRGRHDTSIRDDDVIKRGGASLTSSHMAKPQKQLAAAVCHGCIQMATCPSPPACHVVTSQDITKCVREKYKPVCVLFVCLTQRRVVWMSCSSWCSLVLCAPSRWWTLTATTSSTSPFKTSRTRSCRCGDTEVCRLCGSCCHAHELN